MLGVDRKKSLRATQTTRPEIDLTADRLRFRGPKIQDRDARGASRINGHQQIFLLIEGIGEGEHVDRVGPIT